MKKIAIAIFIVLMFFPEAYAQKAKDGTRYKPILYVQGYEHDKWGISPQDHVFEFRAYTTSFDGADDNDGDSIDDKWGVNSNNCIRGGEVLYSFYDLLY